MRQALLTGAVLLTCALVAPARQARSDVLDPPLPGSVATGPAPSAEVRPPVRAFNVHVGFRLAWAELRDSHEAPVAGGPGMAFDIGYRPIRFLAIGGELLYARYGWSHHEERFRLVDERGQETPLQLRYARKNDLAPLVLFTRLQPASGRVRPYLQGLVGVTLFQTTVDHAAIEGDEDPIIKDTAPVALSAGAEVGLDFVLASRRHSAPAHHLATMLLSVGIRRIWNTRATYGLPGPLAAGSARTPSASHVLLVGITARADRLQAPASR